MNHKEAAIAAMLISVYKNPIVIFIILRLECTLSYLCAFK